MGENSKIEWCDHTVNLWHGCYEVHKGCDHCYAKTLSNRYHGPDLLWQQQGPRMYIKSALGDLNRYQARAAKEGKQYIIFMNSMSDIFEKSMPVVDNKNELMLNEDDDYMYTSHLRQKFFKLVDDSPNLLFLLLTKRPSNIAKMVPEDWLSNPRKNVMYGTSIVDNSSLETLYFQLMDVPGYHFLSLEPLIEGISLRPFFLKKIPDWVIIGGESGIGARPMNSIWVENIKADCDGANGLPGKGIPFFMKQWGENLPLEVGPDFARAADGSNRFFHYEQNVNDHKFIRSNDQTFYHIGKKDAGALLFGHPHKNFPKTVWPR